MLDDLDEIERQELIQKLYDNGYGHLADAFLFNESKCFFKKSKLNKSGACRVLGWKTKQLEEVFSQCRKLLGQDNL